MAGVETDGVKLVGEVITRVEREAIVADDYRNAWIAGANHALQLASSRMQMLISQAGPYDDTRALQDTVAWVNDTILAIHSPEFYAQATNGNAR